jgi:predicted HTH domain antitoxin
MTLELPDAIVEQSGCSADELKIQLVCSLWSQGKLTLGQTGAMLGLGRPAMLDVIYERGYSHSYDVEDVKKGVEAIDRLWPARKS